MRRVILSILIFLSFFCGYVCADKEEIEEEKGPYFWDFGKVNEGDVLEHEFAITNKTYKVLNIKSISTSCGCTTSETKDKEVRPFKSVKILVKFNTKNYTGVKKQYVYIETDQKEKPLIRLMLKADIQPLSSSR